MDEKSIQVARMGDIYRQAKKVIIWLGEADESIPQTLAFFRVLGSLNRDDSDEYNEPLVNESVVNKALVDMFGHDFVTPVEQFLQRPWFERRFVIQEAALSHHTIVCCGSAKLAWGWLSDALEVLRKACERGFKLNRRALQAVYTICTIRENDGRILDLIGRFHNAQCSDPKDRIFALYGLASDLNPALRNVDDFEA